MAGAIEDGRGDDEDGGIDEQGQGEGQGGIEVGHLNGLALAFGGALVAAALDDRGVQIEVVGHDGGAQHADGDVEHVGVGDDGAGGNERSWSAGQ